MTAVPEAPRQQSLTGRRRDLEEALTRSLQRAAEHGPEFTVPVVDTNTRSTNRQALLPAAVVAITLAIVGAGYITNELGQATAPPSRPHTQVATQSPRTYTLDELMAAGSRLFNNWRDGGVPIITSAPQHDFSGIVVTVSAEQYGTDPTVLGQQLELVAGVPVKVEVGQP